jgi:hypothetical protein
MGRLAWAGVVTARTETQCRRKLLEYLTLEKDAGFCLVLRRGLLPQHAAGAQQYIGGRLVDVVKGE